MVVIDAAKHKLDYKRSEIENDIPTLRKRWQGYTDPETGKEKGGASTCSPGASRPSMFPSVRAVDALTGRLAKSSIRSLVEPI